MGERGPQPTPTALKIMRGNPGHRPINKKEPKPRVGTPCCPSWLDTEAKACWERTVPELEHMGVLTLIDADALAVYCDTWSRWKDAVLFLQKNGAVYTIKDEEGKAKCVQQWPQVSIARNLLAALNRWMREFGMTPSARTSIVAKPPEEGDLDDFVKSKPWLKAAE